MAEQAAFQGQAMCTVHKDTGSVRSAQAEDTKWCMVVRVAAARGIS